MCTKHLALLHMTSVCLKRHGFARWTPLVRRNWLDGCSQRAAATAQGSSGDQWWVLLPRGWCWGWLCLTSLWQWGWIHPQQGCWWHQAAWCIQHTGEKACHPEGSSEAWEDHENFMILRQTRWKLVYTESQLYPGMMHQKQYGQQVKGHVFSPLLHSYDASISGIHT